MTDPAMDPGGPGIYLNAASHGIPSERTVQRMVDHLLLEQQMGPAAARESVEAELEAVRSTGASLIGAAPQDLGLSFTTLAAWRSIVDHLDLSGKEVLIAPHEWGENVEALKFLADRLGFSIDVLPTLRFPSPDLAAWSDRIRDETAAIFVPMVTSVQGLRYPVEAIGDLPRPDHCRLIVDAAQALGQTEIDVIRLGCDALVATCRKWLRGPRGTALFWLNPGAFRDMSVAELEPFDANVSARLGLGNAIREAMEMGLETIEHRIADLVRHATGRARELDIAVHAEGDPASGAVCLLLPEAVARSLRESLAASRFWIKWPNPPVDEPEAGSLPEGMHALRLTPHVYNSTVEIDRLFDCLKRTLRPA